MWPHLGGRASAWTVLGRRGRRVCVWSRMLKETIERLSSSALGREAAHALSQRGLTAAEIRQVLSAALPLAHERQGAPAREIARRIAEELASPLACDPSTAAELADAVLPFLLALVHERVGAPLHARKDP